MSTHVPQTFQNHARLHPAFHFFIVPVLVITWIGTIVGAIRHPTLHTVWMVVLTAALLVLAFLVRIYALRVQDRVIRLEERMRLATLLQEPMRSRIGELTESQLIALRFASDAEIPALVEQTLAKQLSSKDIKMSIKNWRADYWRV